jgi:hypothetical protein
MVNTDGRRKRLIPDPEVWKRYGVCAMTGYRWDHNPELNFPKPIRINGRKYRDEEELEAFERRAADTVMQRVGKTRCEAPTVEAASHAVRGQQRADVV